MTYHATVTLCAEGLKIEKQTADSGKHEMALLSDAIVSAIAAFDASFAAQGKNWYSIEKAVLESLVKRQGLIGREKAP